jgi:hypothetical protein
MFTNIEQQNSVSKLAGILKSKYGVDFRVTSMLQGLGVDAGDSKGELRGDSLYVTICAEGQYLGTAIMAGAERLSTRDVSMVTEMVKMILEPTLKSVTTLFQAQNLEFQSRQYHAVDDHMEFSNVVDLFQDEHQQPAETHKGPEFLSSLLLLESSSAQTIHKVSVHIHELGGRWALINYREIRNQVKSLRELQELGAMTIVIDDLASLTQAEQNLLITFAEEPNTKAEPLILVGTTTPIRTMYEESKVSPALLQVLTNNRLELDRFPKDFRRLQESLELFLDRKAMFT